MTDCLRRACLLRGNSTPTTTSVALAAAIAAAAAGVTEAQAQTPPRGNVRVILSPGDVVPGQRFPLDTRGLFPAVVADDGSLSIFIGQRRRMVLVPGSDEPIFDPDAQDVPPAATTYSFSSSAYVAGRVGNLSMRFQTGTPTTHGALRNVLSPGIRAGSIAPSAQADAVFFYDTGIDPHGIMSAVSGEIDYGLWKYQEGAFTSVARRGDVAPGFESIGYRLADPFVNLAGSDGTVVYTADLLAADGSDRYQSASVIHRAGVSRAVYDPAAPLLDDCEDHDSRWLQATLLTARGDVVATAFESCLAVGGESTYSRGLLSFTSQGATPLLLSDTDLPGARVGSANAWAVALAECGDGGVVALAGIYMPDYYFQGLFAILPTGRTAIHTSEDADSVAPPGTGNGYWVVGVDDSSTLYYVIFTDTSPPADQFRYQVRTWRNGTTTILHDSADEPSPADARCHPEVWWTGLDPRGGALLWLHPYCAVAGTPQTGHHGLYRATPASRTLQPLIARGDSIALPDGTFGAIADVSPCTYNGPATNHFGQMLVSVTVAGHADPFLVLLETTALCREDYNADGVLDPDDLGDYITAFFSPDPTLRTDVDEDGVVTTNDLGDYITNYFAGC